MTCYTQVVLFQNTIRQGCPSKGEKLHWATYNPKAYIAPIPCKRTFKKSPLSIVLGYSHKKCYINFILLQLLQTKKMVRCHYGFFNM